MLDASEVVEDVSTTLTPVQGMQLIRTSLPHPSNYHDRGSHRQVCTGKEGGQYVLLPHMYTKGKKV